MKTKYQAIKTTSANIVILAGGESRRMGGGDKCLRTIGGLTLLEYLLLRLRPQAENIFLNVNGDPARFAQYQLPIINDGDAQGLGPLAGVRAALTHFETLRASGPVLFVPSDCPFLPMNLFEKLKHSLERQRLDIGYAECNGQSHYTTSLWSLEMRHALKRYLDEGGRAVHKFLTLHNAAAVSFPREEKCDPFFNINSPADLELAISLLDTHADMNKLHDSNKKHF